MNVMAYENYDYPVMPMSFEVEEDILYDYKDDEVNVFENEQAIAGNAWEAYVHSLNQYGCINLRYMSQISGFSVSELIAKLAGKVMWRRPSKNILMLDESEGWLTKEEYIYTGNLYDLLSEAKRWNKKYGLFQANIDLIKSVIPDAPMKDEIEVSLGATWVPKAYFEQFIAYITDSSCPKLEYDDVRGKWHIESEGEIKNQVKNRFSYGTLRMSAMKIIEHIMNVTPVCVYDAGEKRPNGTTEYVINLEETMAAREKKDAIVNEFKLWLKNHPKIMSHLQQVYTEKYCYTICKYDGSILELPGLNPLVRLYKHQKDAIARIVLSKGNVLLSHSVGAGKTYVFEIGITECVRMGLAKKVLMVIPNAVLDAAIQSYRYLYPDREVVAIYPDEFNCHDRAGILKAIENRETGIFIMASSSFDMLQMSKQYYVDKKKEQISHMKNLRDNAWKASIRKSAQSKLEKLREEFYEWNTSFVETELNCFDRLNIDMLVVDECHNYKNITLSYNSDSLVGLHSSGSKKADSMLEKTLFVQRNGGRIIFATGTPITNSMADLYVLQTYLQPAELEMLKISRFNEWLNTFAREEKDFEVDVSAVGYKLVTRMNKFHNLPELMSLFSNVSDFYNNDTVEFDLPDFNGYQDIIIKKSEAQNAYIERIVERIEAIHDGKVSPTEDNFLKITTDGRKCALDMRLVEPDLCINPDEETKVGVCANKIMEVYEAYPDSTQVVFCDCSTPKDGFNMYDELKYLLIMKGMKNSEIAFIHEGTTKQKRRKLLESFNKGEIKLMIGSTQKLGTGVNVQENLIAIHHLDIPWKPADLTQREGRAIRQGNNNNEVFVFRYVTEGSFDAYIYQILENKQKFISSFLLGTMNPAHREESDVSDMVLSYAEIKALAIGNPLIKERVETANRLERVRISFRQRRKELVQMNSILSSLPAQIKKHRELIETVVGDMEYLEQNKSPMSLEEREEFGKELLEALAANKLQEKERVFDWYQEFDVVLPADMLLDEPYVIVRRENGGSYKVKMDGDKALGCAMRIDKLFGSFAERKQNLTEKLESLINQQKEAKELLNKGNPYERMVDELEKELQAIDDKLSEEDKRDE